MSVDRPDDRDLVAVCLRIEQPEVFERDRLPASGALARAKGDHRSGKAHDEARG